MTEPIDPNKAVDFLLTNAGKYARAKAERVHIEEYLYENTVINVKIAQRPKRSGLRRHFPHHCHERTSGMSTTHSTDICQPIPGWPEYQISKYGDVSRIAPACGAVVGKNLKWQILKTGYAKVSLCRGSVRREYLVHRLVAMTYIGDPSGMDVCHFDGNKTNNALSNLRIDNRKGNMRDQIRMEKTPRGEKSGSNKYSESLIKIVKEKLLAGENVSSLHLATGIPKTSLYSIKRGDNWGWL